MVDETNVFEWFHPLAECQQRNHVIPQPFANFQTNCPEQYQSQFIFLVCCEG